MLFAPVAALTPATLGSSLTALWAAAALIVAPTSTVEGAPASSSEPAAQAESADDDDPNARFARAEALYREGRYEAAIAILDALLADYPEPILYFNLGRAYESSGRIAEAITAYESYLDADPDAPDRTSVRDRIGRLEARLPKPVPAPQSLPPTTTHEPTRARRPIVAPWVIAGLGGAGLTVGVAFAGLSRARSLDARRAPSQVAAASEHAAARRHALAANVALGVGAALVVAGVAWGIAAVVSRRRALTGKHR